MLSKRSKKVPNDVMQNVEKWPAHALGRVYGSSSILVANERLRVLTQQETKFSSNNSQPKFLTYLEEQIQLNLKPLRTDDVEGRFQVFKEAFQLVISVFKTYQPMLSKIAKEYEDIIQHYKRELQKLRPSQEYLWTISQECDQRVLAIQAQGKPELEHLHHEIMHWKSQLVKKKEEQVTMQIEIDKLKASLEEEHGRYRHEADAKNLLVTELNELRNQCDELERTTKQAHAESTKAGDPMLLRIALEQAKKAESEAELELTKMKADYVDLVPKKQYELLVQSKEALEAKIIEQEVKFADLNEALAQCEAQLNGMIEQRDEYKRSLQQLNRASTPRPQWDEAGRSLACGLSKWNEDTHGMSSQQKMQHLIKTLSKPSKTDEREARQLDSMGTGDDVPRFLRCEDPFVPRRSIHLRDCFLLTEEIWTQRRQEKDSYKVRAVPATKPTATNWKSFDEFLEHFFIQVYGIPRIRLEWAYAYYETITNQEDYFPLHEMQRIIDNELEENCHWHLQTWLERAEKQVRRMATDISEGDDPEHAVIDQDQLQIALTAVTGSQFESKISSLVEQATLVNERHLHAQAEDNEVTLDSSKLLDVDLLFSREPGEDFNSFIRELIELYNIIKLGFVEEIITELEKVIENVEGKEVNAAQLREAITVAYKNSGATFDTAVGKKELTIIEPIRKSDLDACIEWIMRPNLNEPTMSVIPHETAVKRLKGANLFPAPKDN